MSKTYAKVEAVTNVAIVAAAAALCVVLIKSYAPYFSRMAPSAGADKENSRLVGTSLLLPGVDRGNRDRTLVLALSSRCDYCTASAGFYRKLIEQKKKGRRGVYVIALLPQDAAEGKRYLDSLGVEVDELRQSSLGELGVTGTPTLLLLDGSGVVTDSWEGKLTPEQESKVLSRI